MIANGVVSEDIVTDVLIRAALDSGLRGGEAEARRNAASGLLHGAAT